MFWCGRCRVHKPRADFYECNLQRQPNSSWCRECRRAYQRGRQRGFDLKRKFGISEAEYEQMRQAQGGVCAICHCPELAMRAGKLLPLAIDHNHATGKIRSLLCGRCNRALGLLDDSPERARALAAYIEQDMAVFDVA